MNCATVFFVSGSFISTVKKYLLTHKKFCLSEQDLADNDADAAESQVLHEPSSLELQSAFDDETMAPGPSTRDPRVRKRKQPSDQPTQANESVVIQFQVLVVLFSVKSLVVI